MSAEDVMQRLERCLSRLPGVGRRSGARMAAKLARDPDGILRQLVSVLDEVRNQVCVCSSCGSLTSEEENPCPLCSSALRDGTVLCVVEDPSDIVSIEKSGEYKGRYHALMGKLSPMRGEGPDDLRIQDLLDRLDREPFREIILALNTDAESDATCSYLASLLAKREILVTRIAFGLPVGSGIMYADELTLSRAIAGRQAL